MDEQDFMPIQGIDHVEYWVGNARQAAYFYSKAFGFRVTAYAGPETVTCVIPGHERTGRELVVDELSARTGSLGFEYRGVCAYESTFDYAG